MRLSRAHPSSWSEPQLINLSRPDLRLRHLTDQPRQKPPTWRRGRSGPAVRARPCVCLPASLHQLLIWVIVFPAHGWSYSRITADRRADRDQLTTRAGCWGPHRGRQLCSRPCTARRVRLTDCLGMFDKNVWRCLHRGTQLISDHAPSPPRHAHFLPPLTTATDTRRAPPGSPLASHSLLPSPFLSPCQLLSDGAERTPGVVVVVGGGRGCVSVQRSALRQLSGGKRARR